MKRSILLANAAIVVTLGVLAFVVFSVDLGSVFLTVSAPLYNGRRDTNNVSIMLTVGGATAADSETVCAIKEILADRGVEATWFLGGSWITRNPTTTQSLAQRFEIGNYAFSSGDMRTMTESAKRSEIQATHNLVKSLTGVCMNLFAPHMGNYNRGMLRVSEGLGYRTIIGTRAEVQPRGGDIIVLKASTETASTLLRRIDDLLTQGFNIIPVGQNINFASRTLC